MTTRFLRVVELEMSIEFRVETEQEGDGRWIAEIPDLPGTLSYGTSEDEAIAKVQALAVRVLADRLEHAEAGREYLEISFHAA
jgi:predicted RNase H-like HicB family nuclease